MTTAFATQNGATTSATTSAQIPSWQRLSVGQFFNAFNWDNQSQAVQELKQQILQGDPEPLGSMVTVGQFFSAIPWEGAAATPAPKPSAAPAAGQSQANEFTLDDFSSLF